MSVAALTLELTGCGGGSGSPTNDGQLDAIAACSALARTTDLSKVSLTGADRISAAYALAQAAAREAKAYASLEKPFRRVMNDVELFARSRMPADALTALAACKADKVSKT